MLASTIQFSKYGQEHQPRTTTTQDNTLRGNNTPLKHHHQTFGESRPQPHHHTKTHKGPGAASDPEKPVQPQHFRDGPIPQDPTARLDDSLHHHHVPHPIPEGTRQY